MRTFDMGYKIAIAGATGNVGREMLEILADRELSDDGQTLTVTQTAHLVDIASFTNVSVCRRSQ